MKILLDIYNVIKETDIDKNAKRIYKMMNIDLDNYKVVSPGTKCTYLNSSMLAEIPLKEINNIVLNKDGTQNVLDVTCITTVTEDTLRAIAHNTQYKPKIENLTDLLDFLRQRNATLITSSFNRKKSLVTVDGIYAEVPKIYSAYFKNIKYSSKDLGISIPYIVNGILTNNFDGTSEDVKRLVSAAIVDNNGKAIKSMDVIIDLDSYTLLKDSINQTDLIELETGMKHSIDDEERIYYASRISDTAILLTVKMDKLMKYTPIKNGQVDTLCHPAVIEDTIYRLNCIVRMIKTYRGINNLLKMNEDILNSLQEKESLYDIPSLSSEVESVGPTIEFYIKGKKVVPSFKKLMNMYLKYNDIEQELTEAILTSNVSAIKAIADKVKVKLGVTEELNILDEANLLNTVKNEDILPVIAYSSFLNSINITTDIKSKYYENLERIAELESIRETLKARLSHVRYCLYTQGSLPLNQRHRVIIEIANADHIKM